MIQAWNFRREKVALAADAIHVDDPDPHVHVIQLRPLMITMILAIFGLVAAALATGIGSDVQRPLATVIVGGLISALILSLTVLPPLYQLVEGTKQIVKLDL